jgi:S1-C subfamily serine protease
VTPDIAESLGLKRPTGALVATVTDKSPAARAGLKTGDLIVAIDGQLVDDSNAFDYRFATKPLRGSAQLGILRGGKELKAAVALETAPETPRDELLIRARSPFMGVTVANISPALAEELRLDSSAEGVVILDVATGSLAQSIGFQRGDIITSVNNEKITRTRDLDRIAKDTTRRWAITVVRGGQTISLQLGG